MKITKTTSRLLGGAALAGLMLAGAAASAETIFLSTQLRPLEEAQAMRGDILKGVPDVNYVVEEPPQFPIRMTAESQTGRHTISLVGALHGELAPLAERDIFMPLNDLAAELAAAGMPQSVLDLGKLGTDDQEYIPWMQATYVMAAKKEALEYLPEGADINALTYEQLIAWGQAMKDATGAERIGFPAGPNGLMARFFEGYFYPSYTGGVVRSFRSADAVAGWEEFKELWSVVTPNSTNYAFMQEPLLADEVWVAWDHVARLKEALNVFPEDFVTFPAPAGPHGRGYMPVIAGLAIPQGAPDVDGATAIIRHLTQTDTQLLTAELVAFFPTMEVDLPEGGEDGVSLLASAVSATQSAPDALISLLPIGLGDKGGEFNKVYMDTFQRIVLNGEDIAATLAAEGDVLNALMQDTGAPCWAPDASSEGACPVE
ncbi:family 1 extracellular solute-binding protein [Ketogulonicigenium robustum]|uniref:Family 1 extracellular solute-binding protein n=1 Tax=Ketogulonicigenium robustum TaxID=92947 RepID=A0A1W6NZD1_9RHOB|nr:extracellular solute-binding protein [Ketogulonicigenium robustum]ARO14605.1 family 1 extracellular solute-binding protein [Ketogulonicigenium robustum]